MSTQSRAGSPRWESLSAFDLAVGGEGLVADAETICRGRVETYKVYDLGSEMKVGGVSRSWDMETHSWICEGYFNGRVNDGNHFQESTIRGVLTKMWEAMQRKEQS